MICRNHLDVEEGVRRCARCEQAFCGDCLVDIQGRPFCADCKAERLLDVRSGVDPTRMQYSGQTRPVCLVGGRYGASDPCGI